MGHASRLRAGVLTLVAATALLLPGCKGERDVPAAAPTNYLDSSGRDDALAGGARMIPVETPNGIYRVWTKRVGSNPRVKVLLLHMMASIPAYNDYAQQHLLRLPPEEWPDPVARTFKHINTKVYDPMQKPSELGASGKLIDWDRTKATSRCTTTRRCT